MDQTSKSINEEMMRLKIDDRFDNNKKQMENKVKVSVWVCMCVTHCVCWVCLYKYHVCVCVCLMSVFNFSSILANGKGKKGDIHTRNMFCSCSSLQIRLKIQPL